MQISEKSEDPRENRRCGVFKFVIVSSKRPAVFSPATELPLRTSESLAMAIMAFLSSPPHISSLVRPFHSNFLLSPISSSIALRRSNRPSLFGAQTLANSGFCSRIHCSDKERAPPVAQSSDPKAGVPIYKPKTYEVLVSDAATSLAYALEDGKIRLEIDFP